MKYSDKCSGLVSWFDCYFTHGIDHVILPTSPYMQSTHWKQTIFYFEKSFEVKEDDYIKGSICVKKN